jgi:hypothetical protein
MGRRHCSSSLIIALSGAGCNELAKPENDSQNHHGNTHVRAPGYKFALQVFKATTKAKGAEGCEFGGGAVERDVFGERRIFGKRANR